MLNKTTFNKDGERVSSPNTDSDMILRHLQFEKHEDYVRKRHTQATRFEEIDAELLEEDDTHVSLNFKVFDPTNMYTIQ